MTGPSRIIQDLRRARVLVVHPRDEDGNTLIAHLKRLGCEVRATWPLPPALPPDVDTVFLHVEDTHVEHALQIIDLQQTAIIAILTYESPTALQAIIDLNAHGVISKPLRPLGILTQFALARYRQSYEKRLAGKVQKLEETLKSRRLVEKAVSALRAMNGLDEEAAYKLLRDQATSKRVPMATIAESIIAAQDTMKSLGLSIGGKSEL
ncbi:ANTAR domain-containing response regulator [Rhizobium multihospitium]|uniref:Two-component response regulator, AmiR/NasT family, consists of REC and RNA-binding antiterminator (ANTAR) domains n=1 Tax=Rhizobium multihospitium TaxID=410764 RepID=A0A1C3U5B7_9HYPH|nr:ANTAR domain-containing protein [Rhizobium multihospitium]SCB10689.1 Two-component response regulator, AmiR/NasT family, consists of REC and RNA-binding antiterminator (ANTAR) domains [Rhizobium multihospitium]